MESRITVRFGTVAIIGVLTLGAFVMPASAHNGVDHSVTPSHTKEVLSDAQRVEKMHELLKAMQELVVLLQKKAVLHSGDDEHDDEDAHGDELQVWVEIHSNKTHAHVKEVGKEEESFLFEDLSYTDEEEIIAAIAHETGLSEALIEDVIEFPSGEVDEHGDSVEEHGSHEDEDVSGIHIMSDGTIMWGNGEEVVGATLTADNKIELEDGRIITPAFDLR